MFLHFASFCSATNDRTSDCSRSKKKRSSLAYEAIVRNLTTCLLLKEGLMGVTHFSAHARSRFCSTIALGGPSCTPQPLRCTGQGWCPPHPTLWPKRPELSGPALLVCRNHAAPPRRVLGPRLGPREPGSTVPVARHASAGAGPAGVVCVARSEGRRGLPVHHHHL